ncbi:ribosomal subunit interface protein [Kitasatospora herbaricolor]|uniref:ribosome hibernation-promoting factor, HPF/YfiA family n=1 Tax=Kitasatospora herbaricolor TaxID=68217 RepID=UPI00174A64DD|nr:ribosome-associated translation inhibitor RaiA [Kitasatospora herbaricolor]MDQ0308637.1 ribosomal subunit interface protein [Kitasatospora herbaricolor]GGV13837.1 ribosomal subunit interface protein [Kitasatospora herbaricolor]
MDIVVKGRKTEVPKRFREHVAEKLEKVQKFDGKVISLDVEVSKEHNPRQADRSERVEITVRTRGPVIRAEAAAADPYAALDLASAKLDAQLRKSADRRRVHKGGNGRTPISVAEATAALAALPETEKVDNGANGAVRKTKMGSLEVEGDGPLVVREKTHPAAPMALDQALYEMELVGHDFYLFVEKDSGLPSVVYRRHGYHYGVIHLKADGNAVAGEAGGAGGAIGGPDDED